MLIEYIRYNGRTDGSKGQSVDILHPKFGCRSILSNIAATEEIEYFGNIEQGVAVIDEKEITEDDILFYISEWWGVDEAELIELAS